MYEQAAVSVMESQHGQRLGAEADRYAAQTREMARERDAAAAERQATADAHARQLAEVISNYEAQLQVPPAVLASARACSFMHLLRMCTCCWHTSMERCCGWSVIIAIMSRLNGRGHAAALPCACDACISAGAAFACPPG